MHRRRSIRTLRQSVGDRAASNHSWGRQTGSLYVVLRGTKCYGTALLGPDPRLLANQVAKTLPTRVATT